MRTVHEEEVEQRREIKRRRCKIGKLGNVMQVATELGRLYRQARWKELSSADAGRLAAILTALRQCYELTEVQTEIRQLRDMLEKPVEDVPLLKSETVE